MSPWWYSPKYARFWSILFSVFTPNFAPRVVRSPWAFSSSQMVCIALPSAYSANIRCTNGAVSGSTMYLFVDLSTP